MLIKIRRKDIDMTDIKKYRFMEYVNHSRIDGYPLFFITLDISTLRRLKIEKIRGNPPIDMIDILRKEFKDDLMIVSTLDDHFIL